MRKPRKYIDFKKSLTKSRNKLKTKAGREKRMKSDLEKLNAHREAIKIHKKFLTAKKRGNTPRMKELENSFKIVKKKKSVATTYGSLKAGNKTITRTYVATDLETTWYEEMQNIAEIENAGRIATLVIIISGKGKYQQSHTASNSYSETEFLEAIANDENLADETAEYIKNFASGQIINIELVVYKYYFQ